MIFEGLPCIQNNQYTTYPLEYSSSAVVQPTQLTKSLSAIKPVKVLQHNSVNTESLSLVYENSKLEEGGRHAFLWMFIRNLEIIPQ